MKISVILAHPKKGSLNHAIAGAVRAQLVADRHHVVFHDLYAESFDPVLPSAEIPRDASIPPLVAVHCEEIRDADGIIVIHPNWWGQPPAILKGWIDRVIRPGIAYRFIGGDGGEGIPEGLLHATAALVFTTSNTSLGREMAVFGDPLETLWGRCIFPLCGVKNFHRRNFAVVVTSSIEERTAWLAEVRRFVNQIFPADSPPRPQQGDEKIPLLCGQENPTSRPAV